MYQMRSFRTQMMYECYLSLSTMGVLGMILFFIFFMQFNTVCPWIFAAVYGLYTLIIAIRYIYKVHITGVEAFEPILWFTLLDGIFISFFLYFAKEYFEFSFHIFYIYLILISMLFNHKKTLLFSCFVSLCYIVLVVVADIKNLFSFNILINILLFFLLGYVLSSIITEINKLESKMGYIYQDLETKNLVLNEMIRKDFLTNLYNHKTFYLYYKQFIQHSYESNSSFSLAMLDIDNFKKINDTYGHLAGDMILKEVSTLISNNIQDDDIAARYGGEEFAIIFPHSDLQQNIKTCEKIRNAIEAHTFSINEHIIKITISGGVGQRRFKKLNSKQSILLESADQLMYEAKSVGKNKILSSQKILIIND